MDQAQREHLAQQIRQAFAKTPYPKGMFSNPQWPKIFPKKHWDEISIQALRYYDEIAYITLEEKRYVLPALMIAITLEHEDTEFLSETIITGVLAPFKNDEDVFIANYLKTMTHAECVATSHQPS